MIRLYYLATVLFLLLDILLDVNVRVAFLDNQPVLRASYYAMLFTCMVLILWRPCLRHGWLPGFFAEFNVISTI